jgi:hypothetical protein
MGLRGTEPESYITEFTLGYEDKPLSHVGVSVAADLITKEFQFEVFWR